MVHGFVSTTPEPKLLVSCAGHLMTQCSIALTIALHLSIRTKLIELPTKREGKLTPVPSSGFVVSRRVTGVAEDPFVDDFGSLHIKGGHVFTEGSVGAKTKDTRLRRCGYGVAWIFSDGGLLNTLGGRASILHGKNQSVARAELLAAVEALRLRRSATQQVFIWTDCMFVANGFARERRRKHLSHANFRGEFWKAHNAIGPTVLFHRVWRSHTTEAEIAAGLISPLEAWGNEAADKLAARGALRNALSMEHVAATRNTDSLVRLDQTWLIEINLMLVQNRTKTVHTKAKAPERRDKFDPDEAMSQLNRIGHDSSRVQVGKGRFTYKCRLCFLRGERTFLEQLLGTPCSATSRNVFPLLPSAFPHLTCLSPSSLVTHPLLKTIRLVGGGDFDQDHQDMSDQDLPLSPVELKGSAEMDPCLSIGHTMGVAEPADCESGTPDALCNTTEQTENFQGHVEADGMAAADSRGSFGTVDHTTTRLARSLTLVRSTTAHRHETPAREPEREVEEDTEEGVQHRTSSRNEEGVRDEGHRGGTWS